MKFHVYIDWTCEPTPRAYYVGKGNQARIKREYRNKRHEAIKTKYGLNRRIVFSTDDEDEAFETETRLIIEHKTYVHDPDGWGANFTFGGEGASGAKRSKKTRQRMSEAQTGHTVSDETRQKLSRARRELLDTGWRPILSDDVKRELSEFAVQREKRKRERGWSPSEETRQRMSEARKRMWVKRREKGWRFSDKAKANMKRGQQQRRQREQESKHQ